MSKRTFRARTMTQALAQVRRHLGGHAVILHARESTRRPILGLGPRREWIEVTATDAPLDTDAPEAADWQAAPPKSIPPASATDSIAAHLGPDLARLHALVGQSTRQGQVDLLTPELPSGLVPSYARLVESDMPESLARTLARDAAHSLPPHDLASPDTVRAALTHALEAMVCAAPPIEPLGDTRQIVALVGPPGVGKTTTLAKLAVRTSLDHQMRPGFVTIDTYRTAAIQQLETYARILGVPLAVAREPSDVPRALASLGDTNLVLIDTAGGGPRDEPRLHEIGEFLEIAQADQVHLVLSATTTTRNHQWALERFGRLGVNHLILTKLDEAGALGGVAWLMIRPDLPISYVTTGQCVPDDLEIAEPRRLARLVLEPDLLNFDPPP